MARLPAEKLQLLKKAYTEDGLMPGEAALRVGVTQATAKRWYDTWADEIRRALEARLLPNLEASIKARNKSRKQVKKRRE